MTRAAPSPSGARLAAVLRQLKQRSGLSLAQLANVTTFSKSSWERYLNGKSLPPRSAVIELCRLVGEAADHPLALLDIARTHRTDRTDRADRADGANGTAGTPNEEASAPTRQTSARQRTGTRTDTPSSPSTDAPPDTVPTETATAEAATPEAAPPKGVPGDVHPTPARPPSHRPVTVLTALVSVCAVVIGTLVLLNLPPSHGKERSPSPTPPPATGALCRHDACQDKDPITMKCGAEPMTLAERETATGAWIQIRYSEECGASWARMWGAVVDDRVEIRTGGRDGSLHGARVTTRNEADTYVHTLMNVVNPGTSVQACFRPAAGGAKECVRARQDQSIASPATADSKS
ncbi:XRE family transcriptional regulator [Streptomyces dioscori]|uniref:XRE family transcriptional regulator n=1 Tax=Streptomyces dioscori TaxID=2109333 RepID=A0A2P8QET1_9ACTN|nr:XRE family transcriptional regulator [Streptomyces dioscori]PSM44761.1 XRE family transcriptional regulator [Streptomyces dioscori]